MAVPHECESRAVAMAGGFDAPPVRANPSEIVAGPAWEGKIQAELGSLHRDKSACIRESAFLRFVAVLVDAREAPAFAIRAEHPSSFQISGAHGYGA